MKIVKIVRVEKGNEATGAEQVAAFYNEMEKQGARTSRAIITSVGDDIVIQCLPINVNRRTMIWILMRPARMMVMMITLMIQSMTMRIF